MAVPRFEVPDHRPFPIRRPAVQGRERMVVAGHWLAAQAGDRMLSAGGNAFDAAVAAGLVLNVVMPYWTSLGGIAPIVAYTAADRTVSAVSGVGWWPRRASVEHFVEHHGGDMPWGVPRMLVPGACDAWLALLQRFGSMSIETVAAPAIDLAEAGFPAYPMYQRWMGLLQRQLRQWPTNATVFLHDGQIPQLGALIRQPALGRTLRRLCRAEAAARCDRERGIQAARDELYRGEIAHELVTWYQAHGGLIEMEDLADFAVEIEPAVSSRYGGLEVHGTGFWSQGPVLHQTLAILAGTGVETLDPASPDYAHLIIEAFKLAFADRHEQYGDPRFVDVPAERLLSAAHARLRRGSLNRGRASGAANRLDVSSAAGGSPDTSTVCVVDRWGNAVAATPSDGIYGGPIVPSLGFLASPRGGQSWLDPSHPSAVQGRKRPRITPAPFIVTRDGLPHLVLGASGNDAQLQAILQVLFSIEHHGMDPQRAVEAPRFHTLHHPNSAWPHVARPRRVELEPGFDPIVATALTALGHDVHRWQWDGDTGAGVCVIRVDPTTRTLSAGADPRRDSYAIGW
jgi:gamma-glutamyltranspeptidase/glutathione hydrolase